MDLTRSATTEEMQRSRELRAVADCLEFEAALTRFRASPVNRVHKDDSTDLDVLLSRVGLKVGGLRHDLQNAVNAGIPIRATAR